jgi:hypothetical protein
MYIPSNRIKTNLYTNGSEYQIESTGISYVGFYWKKYTGEIFTGKNPNETPSQKLIPLSSQLELPLNPPLTTQLATTVNNNDLNSLPISNPESFNQGNLFPYLTAKQQPINDTQIKNLPTSYYPKPTQEDYNLGVFTRYFCVKINEDIYLEIDKKTYDALTNQKGDWLWQLYTPFQLLWTISGEEKEIEKTNYNITLLQEKRLKRRGLQEFLRNNYLKFYPSPYSVSDVTSSITPTITPVKENKPSIKDLFKITNPRPNLIISPEEIANAQTATPLVTSSVGNPLTGIRVDTSFEDPKADQRRT